MKKQFALIGAAGYVAKRHFEAIQSVGGELVAALDKHDNVGILDSYFPECRFFNEFERFDRFLDKKRRAGAGIDYLVVCSPNYLHDAHCRFGLRLGADVICEKPLVLNPWNVNALRAIEEETGKKVYTILQLRLHEQVKALKEFVRNTIAERNSISTDEKLQVELTYITSRGNWYYSSWKSDEEKSGGIATNIGIHFFDMLQWVFGQPHKIKLHLRSHDREAGLIEFENASVRWFLSIQERTLPDVVRKKGGRTYRSLKLDGKEWEFSEGFTDLHKESYQHILDGNGFGIEEAKRAIEMVQGIRISGAYLSGDEHPFAKLPLDVHPFLRN